MTETNTKGLTRGLGQSLQCAQRALLPREQVPLRLLARMGSAKVGEQSGTRQRADERQRHLQSVLEEASRRGGQMTADDPRCIALAARQTELYLVMRRLKKHLLDGKAYVPSMTKPQPVLPLPNVTRLRRKA